MRFILVTLFSVIITGITFSQESLIRGFIYSKETGEALTFEKIRLFNATDSTIVAGATTDQEGFFSIAKINKGEYYVRVDVMGFKPFLQDVSVKQAKEIINLRIDLEKEDIKELSEIEVNLADRKKRTDPLVSTIRLDKKAVERVPNIGAENDIVGAFQVTPGVVTTGDQGGQMYVRGGTPIQNKVLLDGMTIYSPFHTIGFFSVFETELIKNVDIYTGGFDAKYGGRISSIMDITYRDGNKTSFGGKVSVSPFMAKAVLEGPFKKHKDGTPSSGTYVLSAKHSLLDYTAKSLYRNVNDGNGMPYTFTDLYGKVSFASKKGSKVNFFGFHNQDSVSYTSANLSWRSTGAGMNFMLVPSSSAMLIKGHLNASNYKTNFSEVNSESRYSEITNFDLGFDFSYFMKNESQLDYGFNFGGLSTDYQTYNEAKQLIQAKNYTNEIGAYVSYKLIYKRLVFQPSFRMQVYTALNTISPEPRLGAKYNVSEKFRLKLSGGRFSQNLTSASSDQDVVNLFNGLLSAPSNVQSSFINSFLKQKSITNGIQYSWHAIFGGEYDLSKRITVNLEAYYKYFPQLSNINQNKIYADESQFYYIDDVYKKDFIIEDGKSYGVDLLVKYSSKRFFVWTSYSYGKSTRWNGFSEYYPVYDRRHNMNLVATYQLGKNKDFEISARWNLGTGLPFTPTAGFYESNNFSSGVTSDPITSNSSTVSTLLGDYNSKRLPDYHRLDITVKKQFNFKNKDVLEIIGSVTNVYNRKNIFYVNRVTGEVIYQFPILPSLGVSYKF